MVHAAVGLVEASSMLPELYFKRTAEQTGFRGDENRLNLKRNCALEL
jgi:hypothetical protein